MNNTKLILSLILFVSIFHADPIKFRLIDVIPYATGGCFPEKCFDSDHDGYNNIIFTYGTLSIPNHVQFWEYRPYDQYILDDTILLRYGGVEDVGFIDADSLVDLLVLINNNETLAVYEQADITQHPKQRVWQYRNQMMGEALITSLDNDQYKEILHSARDQEVWVLETSGDNTYSPVWMDTVNGSWNFAVGDFDNDILTDFATNSTYTVSLFENTGDNQYEMILYDTLPEANPSDVFYSPDLDGNDKPELFFGTFIPFTGSVHLWRYEMTGDNQYEFTMTDSVNIEAGNGFNTRSACADIDADGVNEIVWTSYDNWRVLKATGVGVFERIFELYPTGDWWARTTMVSICDLNKNGYPEVVEAVYRTTNPAQYLTRIWEIEGVRLHYPNGAEVLSPGDTCLIRWEKFYPPGADSFTLFFSCDSGRTYDTIASSIAGSDTSYPWIIPDTVSDSCLIMIWAYGPPRPGEQISRGTAWDFSDSVFAIRPLGIQEGKATCSKLRCEVFPNPFTDQSTVEYSLPRAANVHLALYDAAGQLVASLAKSPMNAGVYRNSIEQEDLPPGVYFLRLTADADHKTYKIIRLK